MSNTVGKRRTVIVSHPDFDKPGGEGVREATEFAKQLMSGQKMMVDMAVQSGQPKEKVELLKQALSDFTIVIRSIEDELF